MFPASLVAEFTRKHPIYPFLRRLDLPQATCSFIRTSPKHFGRVSVAAGIAQQVNADCVVIGCRSYSRKVSVEVFQGGKSSVCTWFDRTPDCAGFAADIAHILQPLASLTPLPIVAFQTGLQPDPGIENVLAQLALPPPNHGSFFLNAAEAGRYVKRALHALYDLTGFRLPTHVLYHCPEFTTIIDYPGDRCRVARGLDAIYAPGGAADVAVVFEVWSLALDIHRRLRGVF